MLILDFIGLVLTMVMWIVAAYFAIRIAVKVIRSINGYAAHQQLLRQHRREP